MQQRLRPQLRTVALCTAVLVAMIATDGLRVVGLHGLTVAAFCLVSSAILGLMLHLEPIVEKRWRLKPARQTTPRAQKGGQRDDRETGSDPKQR